MENNGIQAFIKYLFELLEKTEKDFFDRDNQTPNSIFTKMSKVEREQFFTIIGTALESIINISKDKE